jgi:hypothetical protein
MFEPTEPGELAFEEGDVIKVGCGSRLQRLVAIAIEGTERNIPCELLYCMSSVHPPQAST